MEASNKVFSLIRDERSSKSLVGIFSTCEAAKEEIEKEERRDVLFYIQERDIDSTEEPLYEIEVKYCVKGQKSEMIVTRNSAKSD
jgi:hypothetical protein